MSKKNKIIKGDMRIGKNGRAYYAVVGSNGKFISRKTVGEDKYIYENGEKKYIGRGETGSKRTSQNTSFVKRLQELQEVCNNRQNKEGTKLFDLSDDLELRTHKPYSEQPTTTIWDTEPYRPELDAGLQRAIKNINVREEKPKTLIGKDANGKDIYQRAFEYSENLYKRYGIDRKEQRHYYNILSKANLVIGYALRQSQGDIGYIFSTNFNSITPEVLLTRLEAAEKIIRPNNKVMQKIKEEYDLTDKSKDFFKFSAPYLAQYHITQVSIQYKKDFLENYKQFFKPQDYDRLKNAIEPLPPRTFTKILKTVGMDYLAYYLQSQITTETYSSSLSDIDIVLDAINKYKLGEL